MLVELGLVEQRYAAVREGPLRRAVETARPLAAAAGVALLIERRLRERMNWEGEHVQTLEEFLAEWDRATSDRSFVPVGGDSSEQAATRFLEGLGDIVDGVPPNAAVAVVAHGGVTVDTLRTITGDAYIRDRAPRLLSEGVPSGAVTVLDRDDGSWKVTQLPSTDHLVERPV